MVYISHNLHNCHKFSRHKPYWPKFCDSWSLVLPKKENAYYFHLDCLVAPRCARVPFHKIAARLIHGGPTNGIRVAGLLSLNGRTVCGTLKHTPSTTFLYDCALQLGYTTSITTHILQGHLNAWVGFLSWVERRTLNTPIQDPTILELQKGPH